MKPMEKKWQILFDYISTFMRDVWEAWRGVLKTPEMAQIVQSAHNIKPRAKNLQFSKVYKILILAILRLTANLYHLEALPDTIIGTQILAWCQLKCLKSFCWIGQTA